jgi:sterol-4alpha-carboxylate 3-dehydrogenase (decarboxylating)
MRCAVTGASGFLGSRIVSLLLSERCPFVVDEVVAVDVRDDLGAMREDDRLHFRRTDIRDQSQVRAALEGCELVFHVAAVVDWGRLSTEFIRAVNVEGTQNILDVMKEKEVPYLVATSTMDVAWQGEPIRNGDEELPYASRFTNAYCETKTAAEKLVLKAGDRFTRTGEGPACAVIRPMGIFGEADPYHCTETLKSAEQGKLDMRLGDGSSVFSHVYVDNVAWGQLCAAKSLMEKPHEISGEPYLIGDDTPAENFFDFMETFVTALGYDFPEESKRLNYALAVWIARFSEWYAKIRYPFSNEAPVLTVDSVRMLCLDFHFVDDKARRELDYSPIVDPDTAMERTIEWFRNHGPVRREKTH